MQLLCQVSPEVLELEADVLDAKPGAVLLAQTPAFPGGGGQLPDTASIHWSNGEALVRTMVPDERGWWHEFENGAEISGRVRVSVNPAFRRLMCELHTLAHITNSVVFQNFGGALLTGAQLSADGTFRIDFDLTGSDADRLRALAGPINDVIRQDLPIRAFQMPWDEAQSVPGLFRSKTVSPPRRADGNVRIVEIGALDRQACGGTHLGSTAQTRPVRILKVENKGRQNRRIRVGFVDSVVAP
ncbi:alanyl-tRNA editing protein [Bradyrhizobium sp. BR 10289]|uniref:alanyl-tRNA editing protein n=1 Tax=Bradyrhizobium sp. BR 10289 TaxID=2749993 RepID=UPI001C6520D4|nr:alanyl-tRNA editing protein [Bradyrhizobium sp. BR 10289]MBW7968047.1 alanyl-tRNA editing protein [Bradyrhizobium sp. BR 10289]